jgi:UDP-3-O-[3-hydroxymyristoyl] glucosamine N-acyltransferase
LKNFNTIPYSKIKNYLYNNDINAESNLSKDETFISLRSILNANKNDLTFFSNNSPIKLLKNIKAKACLINKTNSFNLPKTTFPIIVQDPYKSFALISNLFFKQDLSNGKISQMITLDNNVNLNKNIQIDPYVHIKQNTDIGDNVIIENNCTIGPNVTIGNNTVIKSNSAIQNTYIGSNSIISPGVVIGDSGFGFDPLSKTKIQHIGDVVIKDNCIIGSNTTIDRAVFDSTIISENCFIDNMVHIAHNVQIGNDVIIAGQSGIAGSAIIGNNVMIGGQSGIAGHVTIGNNVKIAAKSGVTKNINDNSTVAGFPATDIKKWKLNNIKLSKL